MKNHPRQSTLSSNSTCSHYGLVFLLAWIFACLVGLGQASAQEGTQGRPKLVVGIVVDQMRWDYLYRYQNRYTADGFNRLLHTGFSCNNTFIDHVPSATAVGHATVYTGSVPAIHGIVGNEWVNQATGRGWYCTQDTTVHAVGGSPNAGKMSPRNLLTTTLGDELRIAQNFRSKVIGISLKDRAAILPAGHTATAAYWFDDRTGDFMTSSYYMKTLPAWVQKFNAAKLGQKLVEQPWNTLYPLETYVQSTKDDVPWEGMLSGSVAPVFPYALASAYLKKPGIIRSTPFGNTLMVEFAKETIRSNQLGQGAATDLLAINFASTDYVGHMYGVNSIEIEDTYLRLDKDLAELFHFLDQSIGKSEYVVFLTADHGASFSKGFMDDSKIPTGFWDTGLELKIDDLLIEQFGVPGLVRQDGKLGASYQVHFNLDVVTQHQLDFNRVKKVTIDFLQKQEGVMYAVDLENAAKATLTDRVKTSIMNSYYGKRSGSIQVIPDPGWLPDYSQKGTTHGSWNPYDTHIPLIFMGWGIKAGKTLKRTSMVDIAPTMAALLQVSLPSGSLGNPIEEAILDDNTIEK